MEFVSWDDHSQLNGKIIQMFQTTKQSLFGWKWKDITWDKMRKMTTEAGKITQQNWVLTQNKWRIEYQRNGKSSAADLSQWQMTSFFCHSMSLSILSKSSEPPAKWDEHPSADKKICETGISLKSSMSCPVASTVCNVMRTTTTTATTVASLRGYILHVEFSSGRSNWSWTWNLWVVWK